MKVKHVFNKTKTITSLILSLVLTLGSVVPSYSADNGDGSDQGFPMPTGGSYDLSHTCNLGDAPGGYRFTLLWVDDGIGRDRVGNVSIDAWAENRSRIEEIGWIDVSLDTDKDNRSNYYFPGNAYSFDMACTKNRNRPINYDRHLYFVDV